MSIHDRHEAVRELGHDWREVVARGESNGLVQRTQARGAHKVGGLEELREGHLLAPRLEQEATDLVEGRRDDAAAKHHREEHSWRGGRDSGRASNNGPREGSTGNGVDHVTDDSGQVGLVQHTGLHGLGHRRLDRHAVAEVRDGQGRRGEDEANNKALHSRGHVGQESHEHRHRLEERELDQVRGDGRGEEGGNHRGRHLGNRVLDAHALHKDPVHDGLGHRGQQGLHHGGHRASSHGRQHLGPDTSHSRSLHSRDAATPCRLHAGARNGEGCLAGKGPAGLQGQLPPAREGGCEHVGCRRGSAAGAQEQRPGPQRPAASRRRGACCRDARHAERTRSSRAALDLLCGN
mmetsp:Transcript_62307/g.86064  ORF Transcript_62307/g.86064 Transcript_62307/m.86064 type:complete len:349 (+) Transcript_62307:634-1680(+)